MAPVQPLQSTQQGNTTQPSQQQQGQNSTAPTQQGSMTLFRDWASI